MQVTINAQHFEFYVPKPILARRLSKTLYIERTGNVLQWEKDPDSKTGKVLLQYYLYDLDAAGHEVLYETNILMLDDSGSFLLDPCLADKKTKRFMFTLISGNGVSVNMEDKTPFFYISTHDSHEYDILPEARKEE